MNKRTKRLVSFSTPLFVFSFVVIVFFMPLVGFLFALHFVYFFSITFRILFLSSCEQFCLFDLTVDCSLRIDLVVMYV